MQIWVPRIDTFPEKLKVEAMMTLSFSQMALIKRLVKIYVSPQIGVETAAVARFITVNILAEQGHPFRGVCMLM